MEKTFKVFPNHVNATLLAENDEFEVAILEADAGEGRGFAENKANNHWLMNNNNLKSLHVYDSPFLQHKGTATVVYFV